MNWEAIVKAILELWRAFRPAPPPAPAPTPAPTIPQKPAEPAPAPAPSAAERLLALAEKYKGQDVSPKDAVNDDVACVDSLTNILREQYSTFPKLYYTGALLTSLKLSPHFESSLDAKPGYVIVNATGTGNGSILGHCGIISRNGRVWSNNSKNGLWTDFYTLDTWRSRYRVMGGMPTQIFKPK